MIRAAEQPGGADRRRTRTAGSLVGFTLVEMLVSLAVLGVALTVVGVVFTISVDTTRQAAAYSDVQNWVRQFMRQIEEDLEYCEPSNSVLVIAGRTQAAALTQDDLDAGKFYRVLTGNPANAAGYDPEYSAVVDAGKNYSDPRADILMFFSARPTVSQAPPPNPDRLSDPFGYACANGVKFAPIQVVYGHAALDDAVRSGSGFAFANNPRHIQQTVDGSNQPDKLSRIPAGRWHLSRRATIISPWPNVGLSPSPPADMQFPQGAFPGLQRCEPYQFLGATMAGDAVYFDLPLFLERLSPASFYLPSNPDHWLRPYGFDDADGWHGYALSSVYSLLYGWDATSRQSRHVATVVEDPAADLANNLGVHMLPGCAWFEVEFLMPEDPRNGLEYVDPTPTVSDDWAERGDMPRWTQIPLGETYAFAPDTAANRNLVSGQVDAAGRALSGSRLADFAGLVPTSPGDQYDNVSNRRVRMWPYAIRITVRVFDPRGRLPEPIVRSIVHRFD